MKLVSVFLAAAALGGVRAKAAAAQEPVPPHETFTLHSAALGEARRINVWTPPGYAAGRARYAVLYMPDGGVEEDFPHVVATVDSAVRAGQMRPVIVVGIENTQRRRDMTGPTAVASDSTIAPHVGGSAAFRRFIANELMPEVRRRYRVTDETAVIGESLAGLFVVETFFEQPELFDTYLALSPSLWWNHEVLVRAAAGRLRAQPGLRAALYFSSASDDIGPTTARLAEIFRAARAALGVPAAPRPQAQHHLPRRGTARPARLASAARLRRPAHNSTSAGRDARSTPPCPIPMSILSNLFGRDGSDPPAATIREDDDFVDIGLAITKVKRSLDGTVSVVARGMVEGTVIGLMVDVLPDWKPQEIEGGGCFYWGRLRYRSLGAESDAFIAALSRLYGIGEPPRAMAPRIDVNAVGLNHDPRALASVPAKMKAFFYDDGPDDRQAEVYTNIDLQAKRLEFHEKDPEYRLPLVRALIDPAHP
jgi:predicted alpha/beta superfamily hydrolase